MVLLATANDTLRHFYEVMCSISTSLIFEYDRNVIYGLSYFMLRISDRTTSVYLFVLHVCTVYTFTSTCLVVTPFRPLKSHSILKYHKTSRHQLNKGRGGVVFGCRLKHCIRIPRHPIQPMKYCRTTATYFPHLVYFLYDFWRGKALHLSAIGAAIDNSAVEILDTSDICR